MQERYSEKKGEYYCVAALSLMLVAQLLFTLLEAARHYELQKVLYMNTDTVLESVLPIIAVLCGKLTKSLEYGWKIQR